MIIEEDIAAKTVPDIPTKKKFLYLVVFIDIYSRYSRMVYVCHNERKLVLDAVNQTQAVNILNLG
jgi:hypothetical protein